MPPRNKNKKQYLENLNNEKKVIIDMGDKCKLELVNIAVEYNKDKIINLYPNSFDNL